MADFGVGVPDEIARLSLGQGSTPLDTPPPNIKSEGIVAVDITAKFSDAVKTLEPGAIVKDGFFTLFDSVAALEIMDPKMDSGCTGTEAEVEDLYDVSRPLLPEEVLGIIDQLLCHEMSWHLGYPLSQTLFTSFYVEALSMPDPRSIQEATFVRNGNNDANEQPMLQVLRAYCLGMLKSCGYVNERIKSEHYYEEEDFVTNTYNRTLLANLPTSAIRDVLIEAMAMLKSQRGSIPDELAEALLLRLELRHIFLDAVECPKHMKEADLAKKPWRGGLAILPALNKTHSLVSPVDEAFSAKLQRKLASTMPPRPIVQLEFDVAFGHLKGLFQDGLELIDVLRYTDSQCLLTFVSTFQAKKPQPIVYVRTLLQTFLFDAMEVLGSMSIRQLLDDDFSILTMPAHQYLDRANDDIEATQDPRYAMAQQMELFRTRAAQPFLDILRTACQNRCRVRRTLCHLLRDWESLQVDAEEIDQILQVKVKEQPTMYRSSMSGSGVESYSLPLSSWTYLYKLRQMEQIIQLGFELEVYQADELAGMYWYLNYISKSRLHHTERIKSFVIKRVEETHGHPGNSNPTVDAQLQRSLIYTRLSLLDAAVTWELSDSLSCLYTVLNRLKLIKAPPRPYSTDELRYEIRMRPFAPIGLPVLPTFEEFTAGTLQPDTEIDELFEYAERAVEGAKRGFEALSKMTAEESFSIGSHERWAASVKNGLKSCIATKIAISAVQKAIQKSKDLDNLKIKVDVPTPQKAYHEWWIVPRILPLA
ncbi:amino-acid n-acetyltransferase subunit mak10 [Trichoderma arundinaceum]|uniref:Amino-acid n-acetyltransferase subunit mak10 n=1 Tax=Trichoderma arundinaceum TaxID=490622 RepID=A0A395NLG0_TRIAR|nr:amino-acid n-acetyltransferase subunit mak10 [Trichoderma arundinaceum]